MKGYIRKRGENSWQIIFDLPREANGKRRQGRQTVHGPKRDADAKLREILTAVDKGVYSTPTKETVGSFLNRWLDTYAVTNTRERTVLGYRHVVNRYMIPTLGSLTLIGLRPEHVQGLYASMRERGLSAMTILHTHRLLKEALSHAVKWQVLARNVCDVVDPPQPERKEMTAMDVEAVSRLLEASKASRFHGVFYVALYTGMRRSEILALRWENVDLERCVLHVSAGLHRIDGKGLVLTPTKNAKSRRAVAIAPDVVEMLRQVKGEQLLMQAEFGTEWNPSGFVFTDEFGKPLAPDRMSKEFARIRRSAGLNGIRLHDLRHTHATLMLRAGIPAKIVSERLGHADIGTTMNIYSHVLPGMQEEAAARFSQLLGRGQ